MCIGKMNGIHVTVAETYNTSDFSAKADDCKWLRLLCRLLRKYFKPWIMLCPHLSYHNLMPFLLTV